jgi:hypothetical protein
MLLASFGRVVQRTSTPTSKALLDERNDDGEASADA